MAKAKAKRIVLPKVMSKLITLSLRDLAKAERNKKYRIDMGEWHYREAGTRNRKCAVCQAGAVMAFSLGADPNLEYRPWSFPENHNQLRAINCLRVGVVDGAARWLELSEKQRHLAIKFRREIPPYNPRNPKIFKAAMRKLARELRAAGL